MNFKLEEAIREMYAVLDMWEFMARRTPFNDKDGRDGWTENDARKQYGTWVDDEGQEQICKSAAEQSVVKLIEAVTEYAKEVERDAQSQDWQIRGLKRDIEDITRFANMSDARLGEHMAEHIRMLQEEEDAGTETLVYCPPWYKHLAERLRG